MINKKRFYHVYRSLFGPIRSQDSVSGINAILKEYTDITKEDPTCDMRELAYILATAYHETGGRMYPVREHFANSDEEAYQSVTNWCNRRGRKNYAYKHENGNSYYGRGFVQLTHGANYARMGERLGLPLYDHPNIALDVFSGARILIVGMQEGLFTGKKLSDFFTEDASHTFNARQIVNGLDKAGKIRDHAILMYKALTPPSM